MGDLTDKQILAMGKKTRKKKKKVLFSEYAVKFINLGLNGRDNKTMSRELPAIAKRGAKMVIDSILRDTTMPKKLDKHQQPFITVIIYAGIKDTLGGKTRFIYPSLPKDQHIEEV